MSQPNGENTNENEVIENPGQTTDQTQETPTTLSHEEALAELKRVRAEAASRRVANRELEENAKKWKEYEDSQKTELEKLQAQIAERDKALADKELEVRRTKIAKEFNVADEDLDLLVGDEENMKRLANRLGKKEETPSTDKRPADLLAGKRGTPVGSSGNTFSMDNFIRGSVRNS
jgi:hypothetical protein